MYYVLYGEYDTCFGEYEDVYEAIRVCDALRAHGEKAWIYWHE